VDANVDTVSLVVMSPRWGVFRVTPLALYNGRARSCPGYRLLRYWRNWGRLGNGQGEASKLAPTRHSDSPGQLRLVAGTLVSYLQALGAVRPPPITLGVSLDAGEAVICSSAGGRPSSALAGRLRVLSRAELWRAGDSHCLHALRNIRGIRDDVTCCRANNHMGKFEGPERMLCGLSVCSREGLRSLGNQRQAN